MGKEELDCISSWKAYLPDYKIVRWDESNFDVRCCDYVLEAYRAQKWAFVSDYARIKILFEHGGVYLDTDVELIDTIDDIVGRGPFMGAEQKGTGVAWENCRERDDKLPVGLTVNPGLGMGAQAGNRLLEELLRSYEGERFIEPDGSFNLRTIVSRTTEVLKVHGLRNIDEEQVVDGITIYPADYFNPKDFFTGEVSITERTRSIHRFSASWYSKRDQFSRGLEMRLRRSFPSGRTARRIAEIITTIRYFDVKRVEKYLAKRRGSNE